MRICILKESLCLGGTERSAANISKILANKNDVYFALYNAKEIKYDYGGKLIDLKAPSTNNILWKIINNLLRVRRYNKCIKENKIEVLFEFISISNPLIFLPHRKQIRIISSRDFGGLYASHSRYLKALNASDAIVFNSNYSREFFLSKYPEIENKTFTIYNFIDTDEINNKSNEDIDAECQNFISSHFTIVAVGRFCKEKGFEFLLRSFKLASDAFPKLGLLLVGDGEYKIKYEKIITELSIKDKVYFAGFQSNPYKYMSKCSCFVLSSISEGFPNVLAEAMSLGLPSISTNCHSGPAEILRNDMDYNSVNDKYVCCDYGILTPPFTNDDDFNSINQMAFAIEKIYEDVTVRKNYKKQSLLRIHNFSKIKIEAELNNMIDKLVLRKFK